MVVYLSAATRFGRRWRSCERRIAFQNMSKVKCQKFAGDGPKSARNVECLGQNVNEQASAPRNDRSTFFFLVAHVKDQMAFLSCWQRTRNSRGRSACQNPACVASARRYRSAPVDTPLVWRNARMRPFCQSAFFAVVVLLAALPHLPAQLNPPGQVQVQLDLTMMTCSAEASPQPSFNRRTR